MNIVLLIKRLCNPYTDSPLWLKAALNSTQDIAVHVRPSKQRTIEYLTLILATLLLITKPHETILSFCVAEKLSTQIKTHLTKPNRIFGFTAAKTK